MQDKETPCGVFEKLFGQHPSNATASERSGLRWQFVGSCIDGEEFRLRRLNVWVHKWQHVEWEAAYVKDPIYHQDFVFGVYSITSEGQTVTFAAGEFSNMIWGFYLPADIGGRRA